MRGVGGGGGGREEGGSGRGEGGRGGEKRSKCRAGEVKSRARGALFGSNRDPRSVEEPVGGKNLPGGYRREVVEAGGLKLHKSVNLGVFLAAGRDGQGSYYQTKKFSRWGRAGARDIIQYLGTRHPVPLPPCTSSPSTLAPQL